ncbi:MAG: cytochrome C oxidase subunit IV family protein [Terriglobales bacterium]|jgi:cytochrome c oxidase subunit IV
MSEHIMSSKFYYTIWIALLCLTVITAAVSFVDLGPLNTVVALVIATVKALLVVLFFMHVKYTSEKLTKIVIVSAIFWLFLLLALSMADYATRLLS